MVPIIAVTVVERAPMVQHACAADVLKDSTERFDNINLQASALPDVAYASMMMGLSGCRSALRLPTQCWRLCKRDGELEQDW